MEWGVEGVDRASRSGERESTKAVCVCVCVCLGGGREGRREEGVGEEIMSLFIQKICISDTPTAHRRCVSG